MSTAPDSPATREATIVLADVSKRFGDKEAVRGLSLSLYAGEIFAFLGPNGAGKTTTMKMTIGLLRPDRGQVTVCGQDLRRNGRVAKQQLAYVPDLPFVYDKLTGREFVRFTYEMYGVPHDEAAARLSELNRRLALNGFLDSLCETYSHGMKQRVALAAALIHNPRVLVVDEPMVGLDPRTARVIKDIFLERARAGGTVFMSTHTLDVAEQVADRIGILHRGQLIALGTLRELQAKSAMDGRLEDIFLRLTAEATDEALPE